MPTGVLVTDTTYSLVCLNVLRALATFTFEQTLTGYDQVDRLGPPQSGTTQLSTPSLPWLALAYSVCRIPLAIWAGLVVFLHWLQPLQHLYIPHICCQPCMKSQMGPGTIAMLIWAEQSWVSLLYFLIFTSWRPLRANRQVDWRIMKTTMVQAKSLHQLERGNGFVRHLHDVKQKQGKAITS